MCNFGSINFRLISIAFLHLILVSNVNILSFLCNNNAQLNTHLCLWTLFTVDNIAGLLISHSSKTILHYLKEDIGVVVA